MRITLTMGNRISIKFVVLAFALLVFLCLAIPGCRTNPVTGEDQFILISPEQARLRADKLDAHFAKQTAEK